MATETTQNSTFNAAKQLYAEQFGNAMVTITYLKVALLAMALVAAGLIYTKHQNRSHGPEFQAPGDSH